MGLSQFIRSIQKIAENPRVSTTNGVVRHLGWQARKVLGLFPFQMDYSESKIWAFHRACGVSALINSQGLYDYDNMSFIRNVLDTGDVFFDVGANIGSYALLASENPAVMVHAFEPHPVTSTYLRKNLELNRRTNVSVHTVAVGSAPGEVAFSSAPGSSVNHVLDSSESGGIRVPCVKLDDFCRDNGTSPTILKVDVEGFEYEVLKGAGTVLKSIDVLIPEMNEWLEIRGEGIEKTTRFIVEAGLSGPWKLDYDARVFTPWKKSDSADPFFLSQKGLARVKNDGFKVG